MTSNVLENLSTMVRKSSQNTSNIDFEGGLEAAREPPLCGGDPKTAFWAIWAPLWDPKIRSKLEKIEFGGCLRNAQLQ